MFVKTIAEISNTVEPFYIVVFTSNWQCIFLLLIGKHILSVGDDKHICTWDANDENDEDQESIVVKKASEIINSKAMLTGISYHRHEEKFATCGDVTQLWDGSTNYPIKEFQWGVDTVHTIKFNQVCSFKSLYSLFSISSGRN